MSSINKMLTDLCDGNNVMSEKMLSPYILSYRLRKDIGTITSPKYHFHMKDGMDSIQKDAVIIFKGVVDEFSKVKESDLKSMIKYPYGPWKDPFFFRIKMKIIHFVMVDLKPKVMSIIR